MISGSGGWRVVRKFSLLGSNSHVEDCVRIVIDRLPVSSSLSIRSRVGANEHVELLLLSSADVLGAVSDLCAGLPAAGAGIDRARGAGGCTSGSVGAADGGASFGRAVGSR
jgi:hypothetical protein